MTFQRYRDHRRLIGFLISMDAMKAALITVGECLMSMAAMRAALTTLGESMTSMANTKVRLKSSESEKGAIMDQKPPLKKIKAMLLVWRKPFLETQR